MNTDGDDTGTGYDDDTGAATIIDEDGDVENSKDTSTTKQGKKIINNFFIIPNNSQKILEIKRKTRSD